MQTTICCLPSLRSVRLRRPTILCPLWQLVLVGDYAVWINFRVLINRWRLYLWRVLIRIILRHVISYRDRLGFRLITINYLGLTSLVVPNFTGIWRGHPNDLRFIWQTYRLSLGVLQGHRAAIKAVTCFYFLTVSQGDRLSSRNGVFTLISLSHHIDGHWN